MSDDKQAKASGSETRQRTYAVAVRLNGAERTALIDRADRVGISISAYIRQQVLDVAPPRQRPRPAVEVEKLSLLLGQIGKIGSNLNQIAARLNANEPARKTDFGYLIMLSKHIAEMRAAILEAMGRAP